MLQCDLCGQFTRQVTGSTPKVTGYREDSNIGRQGVLCSLGAVQADKKHLCQITHTLAKALQR